MRLLAWARENGWDIPELRVGSVELRVRDLKPKYKGETNPQRQPDEPSSSIWEQFKPPGADEGKA